ncbi:MAG: ATP-binding cassette domain-containing protein [Planctomycetia bacterium]|nr:ATP-binding cassette domain-containing protein [Planctomycetia bacterium]
MNVSRGTPAADHVDAPAVVMRGITKRFPGVVALADVTLEVRRGELHAICGENGAGKSTLMKILSGVYQPDEGTLEIGGVPARFTGTRDAEQAGIAIIHQELALVEDLSVAANVCLGREKRTARGLLDARGMHGECGRLLTTLECPVSPATRTGSRIGVGEARTDHQASAGRRHHDPLHLAQDGRGLPAGRSDHRPPRWAACPHSEPGRHESPRDHRLDGGPRTGRPRVSPGPPPRADVA